MANLLSPRIQRPNAEDAQMVGLPPVEPGSSERVAARAGEWVVEDAAVAYGGVAPKTIMAGRVRGALLGRPWTGATLDAALAAVAEDVNIAPNAPGMPLLAVLYKREL